MIRNKTLTFSVLLLLMFGLWSCEKTLPSFECSDPIGCVDIAPGQSIKLGLLQTLSGGAVAFGKTQLRTMKLAVEEQGELLGHPIELLIEDSKCSPEGGITAALKIVADPQVIGILGTSCSGSGVTASLVCPKMLSYTF